jgi:predicted nuclease with RNAse H fold
MMLFSDVAYMGIDPTAGTRPIDYAVIDKRKQILAMDQGDIESVLAFVAGLENVIVAIAAPQAPNKGLMRQPEFRRRYNLQPEGKTWAKWRVCEFLLRHRNIRLYNTPADEKKAPGWVRNGFRLFRRLQEMSFQLFQVGEEPAGHTLLEANPHASFSVLLGHRPLLKRTLEGRMQRQLVLYQEGFDIFNPLRVLEEMTRHHLLTGNLPLEGLCESDALDALVAAYTAFLAGEEPRRVTQVGEPEEGLITLPVNELKDFYP